MRSARSGSSLTLKMPRLVRGHQAVVDGLGVAEGAALRDLDGVDVADEVADGRVGGRELLAVPLAAVLPRDRRRVALRLDQPGAAHADRGVRVVVDLAARDVRRPLVEQPDQRADQPGLALAALAEQDEVVAGEQGPLDLGQHRVVEAEDAGEGGLAGGQARQQVGAHLDLDGPVDVAAVAEVAQRRRGRSRSRGSRHLSTLRPGRRPREARKPGQDGLVSTRP